MALGVDEAITAASKLIDDGINKIWPDPYAKATAEAITIKAASDAALAQMAQSMSIMLAEANSADPWTSRARPSFLYVMYILILSGVVIGIVSAVNADTATHIANGMKAWLAAIPDMLWQVFLGCFAVYSGGRTIEKVKGSAK